MDKAEAAKQFKKLIREKEKAPEIKKYIQRWKFVGSVGKNILEGMRRDLEAYRLKKDMKLKDVIKKLGTKVQKENVDDPDVQRVFKRYIQDAKRIIETLEQGNFPRE